MFPYNYDEAFRSSRLPRPMPFPAYRGFGSSGAAETPIPPEEERSLLRGALSGLQWFGETLDKPGAALRGTLAGKPKALLNLIPFSDTLGITDPAERTTGRELLEKVGAFGPNTPGLDWGDAVGLATEVALDPLMLVAGPLGAISKAAQLTSKGAKLAKTSAEIAKGVQGIADVARTEKVIGGLTNTLTPVKWAEQLRSGERGLMGLRLPWEREARVLLGSAQGTPLGQWAARRAADAIETMSYGGGGRLSQALSSPIRGVRGLLSHTAGTRGANPMEFSGEVQKLRDIAWGEKEALQGYIGDGLPVLNAELGNLQEEFMKVADFHGKAGDVKAFNAFTREVRELGMPDTAGVEGALRKSLGVASDAPAPEIVSAAEELSTKHLGVLDNMRRIEKTLYEENRRLGGKGGILNEPYLEHTPRQANEAVYLEPGVEYTQKAAGWRKEYGYDVARRKILRDFPGRTYDLNRWARDEAMTATKGLSKVEQKAFAKELRSRLRAAGVEDDPLWNLATLQRVVGEELYIKPALDAELARGAIDVNTHAAEWARLTMPGVSQSGKQTASVSRQLATYFAKQPKKVLDEGLYPYSVMDDSLKYIHSVIEDNSNLRSLHNLLAGPDVVRVGGQGVQLAEAWKSAGLKPGGLQAFVGDHPEMFGKVEDAAKFAKDLFVDERTARAIKAYREVAKPQVLGPIRSFIDKYTSLWKAGATVAWPSFHSRNLVSGWFQSVTDGHVNPAELTRGYWAAGKHAQKGEGLEFLQEAIDNGMLKHGQIVQILGEKAAREGTHIPEGFLGMRGFLGGQKGKGWGKFGPIPVPNVANPINWKGVREVKPGEEVVQNVLADAGDRAYAYVEFLNRMGYYEALRKKGYTPSMSKFLVDRAQFNYSKASAFERNIAKRGVPFYCVPEHSEILTRGGWKTYDQVEIGDEALTYNVESDELEWGPIRDVAVFPCNTTLMTLDCRGRHLEFTPEHKWVVATGKQHIVHSYGVHDYPSKRKLVPASELNTRHRIVQAAEFKNNAQSIVSPQDARLLGWLLTDGYYRWRKGYLEAIIYQHPHKFLEEVCRVGGGRPRKPHPSTGTIAVPVTQDKLVCLRGYLIHPKSDPFWVEFVANLSREAAEAMYEAMYQGDGIVGHRKADFLACRSHRAGVGEAFRVLAFLLGKVTTPNERGYYIKTGRVIKIHGARMGTKHYVGRVWCPQTDNGTWVMRQGSTITITGNTWLRNNIPYQLVKLAERPGGMQAQTIRAVSAIGQDQDEYTPSFLKETVGMRWGGPDTAATFLRQAGLPIDDLNRLVMEGGRPSSRTLEKAASNLHPLLTMGPELWADKQLFSGRKLSDLEPVTGLGPAVDKVLMASPIGRAITEGGSLLDERKTWPQRALNALTGFKSGTYDTEKWKLIDLENAQQRELGKGPYVRTYEDVYIPKNKRAEAGPEVTEGMRKLRTIQKALKQLRKKRETEAVQQ